MRNDRVVHRGAAAPGRITRRNAFRVLGGGAGLSVAWTLGWTAFDLRRADAAASTTVRIGLSASVNTLDPHMTNTFPTDLSVISHLYSSLVIRDRDLKLHPSVAESWTTASDTRWRFVLRRGVTFPDGEPLDAATVKWNIDRVLNPATKARIAPWFEPIREARVVSGAVLEVETKHPYPDLLAQFSAFFLLAPKWAGSHNPAREAMGTGPYTLKEWVKDDHLTLEARAGYWGGAMPFETVIFRPVPEESSRVAGVLAGDLDVTVDVAPSDFARINKSGRAIAGAVQSTRTAMVKFNTFDKPFNNPAVRQALNYAVNKRALVKDLLDGLTAPSRGQILTPAYFGFNPDLKPYSYDVGRAKQLLAQAGVGDGFAAEFDVPIGRYLLGDQISQAIAGQLAAVGVRAKVTEMPFGIYMDKYLKQHAAAPLMYITWAWPTLDAGGILGLIEKGNPYSYWDNDEFTSLVDKANTTIDPATRRTLYKHATAIMRQEAPVLFLFPQPATYARANTVEWTARPDDWIRAWEMKPKT